MTQPNVAPTAPQGQESHLRRNLIAAGAFVAVGGLAITAGIIHGRSDEPTPASANGDPTRSVNVDEACGQAKFDSPEAPLNADSSKYDAGGFLPNTPIINTDQAQANINVNFNTGPLGTTIDPMSSAAIYSFITGPAKNGPATDNNYNYTDAFATKVAEYSAPGGLDKAKQDCKDSYSTMQQTAQYKDNWAVNGDAITKLAAIRNEKNQIVGMELQPSTATASMNGVEYTWRTTAKDLKGFDSVLQINGNFYVKGTHNGSVKVTPGGEVKATTDQTGVPAGSEGITNGENPEANPGPLKEAKTGDDNTPNASPTTPAGPNGPTTTPTTRPTVVTSTPPSMPPITVTIPPTTPPTVPPTAPPTTKPPTTLPPKDPPKTLPSVPGGY